MNKNRLIRKAEKAKEEAERKAEKAKEAAERDAEKAKEKKERKLPLNQNATNVLMRKAGGKVRSLKSNVVFASGLGTMINRNALMRAFAIAVKKAGLVGVTFHTLLHATHFARGLHRSFPRIDIYKISKLVGHEDIRMTQRYSGGHHCTESLRDGVGILDSDYNR